MCAHHPIPSSSRTHVCQVPTNLYPQPVSFMCAHHPIPTPSHTHVCPHHPLPSPSHSHVCLSFYNLTQLFSCVPSCPPPKFTLTQPFFMCAHPLYPLSVSCPPTTLYPHSAILMCACSSITSSSCSHVCPPPYNLTQPFLCVSITL